MKSFLDMTFAEFVEMLRNLTQYETIHDCNDKTSLALDENRFTMGCQFDLNDKTGKKIRFCADVCDYRNRYDISENPKTDESPNLFLDCTIGELLFDFKITNFFGKHDERRYQVNGIDYSPIDKMGEAMICSIKERTKRRVAAIYATEFEHLNEMDEIMGEGKTIILKPV